MAVTLAYRKVNGCAEDSSKAHNRIPHISCILHYILRKALTGCKFVIVEFFSKVHHIYFREKSLPAIIQLRNLANILSNYHTVNNLIICFKSIHGRQCQHFQMLIIHLKHIQLEFKKRKCLWLIQVLHNVKIVNMSLSLPWLHRLFYSIVRVNIKAWKLFFNRFSVHPHLPFTELNLKDEVTEGLESFHQVIERWCPQCLQFAEDLFSYVPFNPLIVTLLGRNHSYIERFCNPSLISISDFKI